MSDLPPYVEATTYPPFTPRFAASGLRAASSGGEMTAFLTWRSDLPGPGGADRAVTPPGAVQPRSSAWWPRLSKTTTVTGEQQPVMHPIGLRRYRSGGRTLTHGDCVGRAGRAVDACDDDRRLSAAGDHGGAATALADSKAPRVEARRCGDGLGAVMPQSSGPPSRLVRFDTEPHSSLRQETAGPGIRSLPCGEHVLSACSGSTARSSSRNRTSTANGVGLRRALRRPGRLVDHLPS